MQVGIIGLPNVGKSTLFKALTKKQVDTSNYPFCTIDPNVGVVAVPDERLEKLARVSKSAKIIPTSIEFVDIAGLVRNAHQGEGLGNQFLSHIREVDAIVEVLRNFEDKDIIHVEGSIDPQRDKDIIHLELIMADLQTVEKRLEKVKKEAKSGDKMSLETLKVLNLLKENLESGKLVSESNLTKEQEMLVRDLNLLTIKPIIYVYNINSQSSMQVANSQHNMIAINIKQESELAELSDEDLKELGIKRTGLDRLIRISYSLLNLITFFTSGEKETRAWTVKKGVKAPQAAGKIHTDFEKGFIRAEVCNWRDYVEAGGELKAKEKGLIRIEGRDYIMKDGDVVYFRVSN